MKRSYYISDDLDDLEAIEKELEAGGISTPQIHVLSRNEKGATEHNLHQVSSFLKKDVVHSTTIGAVLGAFVAMIVIAVTWFSGLAEQTSWVPFIFLAVVAWGFTTWEAGLFGIQVPNVRFRRFDDALAAGKHVLFVETDRAEEELLRKVLDKHPRLESAGIETTHTKWLILFQRKWQNFLGEAP